jgi:hypothetical protein
MPNKNTQGNRWLKVGLNAPERQLDHWHRLEEKKRRTSKIARDKQRKDKAS